MALLPFLPSDWHANTHSLENNVYCLEDLCIASRNLWDSASSAGSFVYWRFHLSVISHRLRLQGGPVFNLIFEGINVISFDELMVFRCARLA